LLPTAVDETPPPISGVPHFAAALDLPVEAPPRLQPSRPPLETAPSLTRQAEALAREQRAERMRKVYVLGGVAALGAAILVLALVRVAHRPSQAVAAAQPATAAAIASSPPPPAAPPPASPASAPRPPAPTLAAATSSAPLLASAKPAASAPAAASKQGKPPSAASVAAAKPKPSTTHPAAPPRPKKKPSSSSFDPNTL
jgi:hypothetical protein